MKMTDNGLPMNFRPKFIGPIITNVIIKVQNGQSPKARPTMRKTSNSMELEVRLTPPKISPYDTKNWYFLKKKNSGFARGVFLGSLAKNLLQVNFEVFSSPFHDLTFFFVRPMLPQIWSFQILRLVLVQVLVQVVLVELRLIFIFIVVVVVCCALNYDNIISSTTSSSLSSALLYFSRHHCCLCCQHPCYVIVVCCQYFLFAG
jgi:hypothetical protein